MEERGSSGETAAHCISIAEVIDFLQTLTLAYIMLRAREITKKKNQSQKLLQGIKWEETKKNATNSQSVKKQVNSGCLMNSVMQVNSARRNNFSICKISCRSTFLTFSALLSFWYLICNAEFDSNSSCLDRTILARLARKNCKICHKMRSVE